MVDHLRCVRTFYRILMKTAIIHDRHPALKGILALQRQKFYDKFKKEWLELKSNTLPEARSILAHISALMGGGSYYLPGVKAVDIVRRTFRHNDIYAAPAPNAQEALRLSLDAAIACIRVMERNLCKGKEIGVIQDKDCDRAQRGPPQPEGTASPRQYEVGMSEGSLKKGGVLLSHPLLWQSALTRSVVLLVKHDDQASFGLVVNRRVPFTMGDLIDAPDVASSRGMNGAVRETLSVFRNNKIFRGGDVGNTFLSILHPHGGLKGSTKVCEGVYWQCDLAEAKELVESGGASPQSFKLILGYAGWGRGQLQGEVTMNTWLSCDGAGVRGLAYTWGNEGDCEEDADFNEASNTWTDEESWEPMADKKATGVWTSVWESLGGEYAQLAAVPACKDPHI